MPEDIKRELIKDYYKTISKSYHVDIEEFDDRGYILFIIILAINK
jgi:hypothetical protein